MFTFRDFINELEKHNQLLRITEEVSKKHEIAYLLKKFEKKATLLFEKVKESKFKVVGNLYNKKEKLYRLFKARSPIELLSKLEKAVQHPSKPKEGRGLEDMKKLELEKLPILKHYERDAGPYITAAIVAAKSRQHNTENVSIHRLLVVDNKTLAIRIVPRHLYRICQEAKNHGENKIEVAIAIGVNPATFIAASLQVPYGVCEYDVANTLANNALEVAQCPDIDVRVPVDSEIVIEGHINLDKRIREGPFADVLQLYDKVRDEFSVTVTSVLVKEESGIYQALLPGSEEHKLTMGLTAELNIWRAVRKIVDVRDIYLTSGGGKWLHAIISIKKIREGDGKNAILAAFAAHPSLKHVIVVDSDIDPANSEDVDWALATRFNGNKDLVKIEGVRGSSLDPTADNSITTKLGMDATIPLDSPLEKFIRAQIPVTENVKKILQNYDTES